MRACVRAWVYVSAKATIHSQDGQQRKCVGLASINTPRGGFTAGLAQGDEGRGGAVDGAEERLTAEADVEREGETMEGVSEQATFRVKLRWSCCVAAQMLALTSSRATPQGTTDWRSDIETNQNTFSFVSTLTHTHTHTPCVTRLKMQRGSVDQTFLFVQHFPQHIESNPETKIE